MEEIERRDPETACAIREEVFRFEDVSRINDRGVQNLLKCIDSGQLALSLRTASPELREKFFKNISKKAANILEEEMKFMGPVRVSDVENAQREIQRVALRLWEQGELIIPMGGPDEEIVI
jgi:flagellar motor switch protein FliG